jgi:hypothetical protein
MHKTRSRLQLIVNFLISDELFNQSDTKFRGVILQNMTGGKRFACQLSGCNSRGPVTDRNGKV